MLLIFYFFSTNHSHANFYGTGRPVFCGQSELFLMPVDGVRGKPDTDPPEDQKKFLSFCTGSLWYVRGVSMIFLTLERRRYFSFDDHSRIRLKRFCVDFQRIALTQVQVLRKNERKLGCAKISANKVFQRYSCFKSFKTIVKFEVFKTRGKVKRNNKR